MRRPAGVVPTWAVACVLACLACAVVFTGCGDYTDLLVATGPGIFIFDCTKGQIGEYTVYDLFGIAITSGTFDTATHSCVDVQDDLQEGLNIGAAPAARSRPKASSDSPKATAATQLPPEYALDVANYYAVQILDPNTVTFKEIDLPGGALAAAYPVSMAMTPDGKFLWVLQLAILPNNGGITPQPPRISIMDTAKQAFTGSFNLPSGLSVETVRFSPDGTTAYISNSGATSQGSSGIPANSSVLVVDVASQKVTNTIPTPHGAGFEVMSPDGLLLYTINDNIGIGSNYLTAIDTTTGTVAASTSLPDGAIKMFINPTGTRLYIYWYRGIVVVDTASLQQIASIPTVGFSLRNNFATFAPDGRTAWFCNCGYGMYYNVDLRTNTVIRTVQGKDLGHGFMFSTLR